MATTVGTAKGAAAGFGLGESQLSWASAPTGLLSTYQEAQDKVLQLLGEAEQNFDDTGAALDKAADGYEDDERHAVHRMKHVW